MIITDFALFLHYQNEHTLNQMVKLKIYDLIIAQHICNLIIRTTIRRL
jgi:hypothetical protein